MQTIIERHRDAFPVLFPGPVGIIMIPVRLFCLSSCLLVPMMSGTVYGDTSKVEQSIVDRSQNELVNCTLPILLGRELHERVETEPGQKTAVGPPSTGENLMCRELYESSYEAEDNSSYAMGVYLMREVIKDYDEIDWVDFMNGIVRASESAVHVKAARLEGFLRETLLDEAERSDMYLRSFSGKKGVKNVSGVYMRQRTEDSAGNLKPAPTCENENASTRPTHLWMYVQVKPIDEADPKLPEQIPCISFTEADVIRGWRMIADDLEDELTYDVLIPSELAYGDVGNGSSVKGGENLRFIIQPMALAR